MPRKGGVVAPYLLHHVDVGERGRKAYTYMRGDTFCGQVGNPSTTSELDDDPAFCLRLAHTPSALI